MAFRVLSIRMQSKTGCGSALAVRHHDAGIARLGSDRGARTGRQRAGHGSCRVVLASFTQIAFGGPGGEEQVVNRRCRSRPLRAGCGMGFGRHCFQAQRPPYSGSKSPFWINPKNRHHHAFCARAGIFLIANPDSLTLRWGGETIPVCPRLAKCSLYEIA